MSRAIVCALLVAIAVLVSFQEGVSAVDHVVGVNSSYCACVGQLPFTQACVARAISDLDAIATSPDDRLVLELEAGNYTGGCGFNPLAGCGIAVRATNAASIGSPLDGAVFDCDQDSHAFNFTVPMNGSFSMSGVALRNLNANTAAAGVTVRQSDDCFHGFFNLTNVGIYDSAGVGSVGFAVILPTCANDSLPATPHVYTVDGLVCEAVVSAWIGGTGACLELHLDPTRDVVIDSASLFGVRGPAPILVASGNTTTVRNTLFRNCSTDGSEYIVSAGLFSQTSSTVVEDTVAEEIHGGAAIAVNTWDLSSGTLDLVRFAVSNSSGGPGYGTVRFVGGSMQVINSTFSDINALAANGGALRSDSGLPPFVSGCTFRNCSAGNNGGAIFAVGGGITVVDSEFLQVHSVESGGGIYARNGETELQRVVVDLATTDSNGGFLASSNSLVRLTDVNITNTRAGGSGGAIHSQGVVFVDQLRITNATAVGDGGCVFVEVGSVPDGFAFILTLGPGLRLADCHAGGSGGGVYVQGETDVAINDAVVSNSTAGLLGGGIALNVVANIIFDDSLLSGNSALHGGGVAVTADTLSMSRSGIIGNSAGDDGGGLFVRSQDCSVPRLTLTELNITDNAAERAGGGVFLEGAALTMRETLVDSNVARMSGGGFEARCDALVCFEGPRSCEHATISFETTSVTNNVAADGPGGGLALRGTMSFAAELDSVVRGNTATTGGGLFAGSVAVIGRLEIPEEDFLYGNVATLEAGTEISSVATLAQFVPGRAPGVANTGGGAMSGDDLCASDGSGGGGCLIQVFDGFGNLAVTPVLVELGLVGAAGGFADFVSPRFVSVVGGQSEPFFGVRLLLPRGTDLEPSTHDIGLRLDGDSTWSNVAEVAVGPCGPGFGAESDGDNGTVVSCQACRVGYFSSDDSLDVCVACEEGFTTNNTASSNCTPSAEAPAVFDTSVDLVVAIITAITLVLGIVALVASCVRDRSARHGAIGTVVLSVYDVVTDYVFLFSMIERSDLPDATDLTTLITISAGSIGASFLVNLLLTAFVLLRERRRAEFAKWMRGNVVMVSVASVLSTSNVSVLGALGSGVFRIGGTQAPFSQDTEDLISFGGVASVLFEDVPQLVVACLYLVKDPPPDKIVVLLTILASSASVLTGLFLRLILCCVLGVDREDGGTDRDTTGEGAADDDGVPLDSLNPVFGDDGE